jgi:membrane protein YqaA with SNARE-associated domain
MDLFTPENGLLALFGLSFLASTVLPLGSEWLLVALVAKGADPAAAVTVAATGNTAGALTTYWIGLAGAEWLTQKVLRVDEKALERATERYQKYGSWSLLLSWLPVVGDPLCLVAGLMKAGWKRFTLLVAAGKLARYAAVAYLTIRVAGQQ